MKLRTLILHLLLATWIFAAWACAERGEDPVSPGSDAAEWETDPDDESVKHRWRGEPFADAEIFLEFNSTDNDLGVQIFLDGEAWKRVRTLDSDWRSILDFRARGSLAELGITELRFESAEPSPQEVLSIFQPGVYRFFGRTVEGGTLIGEGELSHELPAAPVITPSQGETVDPGDLVIEWTSVSAAEEYELIVVSEESGAELSVILSSEVTSMRVPEEFLEAGAEYKVEVLAIAENGNKTITEGSFNTAED